MLPIINVLTRNDYVCVTEIKHDPAAGLCQYPMIESNLNATYSLHDPINYKGFTQIMNRRRLIWETAQSEFVMFFTGGIVGMAPPKLLICIKF